MSSSAESSRMHSGQPSGRTGRGYCQHRAVVALFYVATADVVYLLGDLARYADPHWNPRRAPDCRSRPSRASSRWWTSIWWAPSCSSSPSGSTSFFVSKIEAAEKSEFAARVLLIRSLDDLKDRLASVIVLVLVVEFLQLALLMKFESAQELLYLSFGIVLVPGYLLTHTSHRAPLTRARILGPGNGGMR